MTITDSIYYENVSLAELLDRYPDPGKVLCWDDLRRLAHDASYLLADTASETIRAEIVRHVSLVARDLRELDAAGPGVIETKLGVIPGWDSPLRRLAAVGRSPVAPRAARIARSEVAAHRRPGRRDAHRGRG
jgi:hypothetical protein